MTAYLTAYFSTAGSTVTIRSRSICAGVICAGEYGLAVGGKIPRMGHPYANIEVVLADEPWFGAVPMEMMIDFFQRIFCSGSR